MEQKKMGAEEGWRMEYDNGGLRDRVGAVEDGASADVRAAVRFTWGCCPHCDEASCLERNRRMDTLDFAFVSEAVMRKLCIIGGDCARLGAYKRILRVYPRSLTCLRRLPEDTVLVSQDCMDGLQNMSGSIRLTALEGRGGMALNSALRAVHLSVGRSREEEQQDGEKPGIVKDNDALVDASSVTITPVRTFTGASLPLESDALEASLERFFKPRGKVVDLGTSTIAVPITHRVHDTLPAVAGKPLRLLVQDQIPCICKCSDDESTASHGSIGEDSSAAPAPVRHAMSNDAPSARIVHPERTKVVLNTKPHKAFSKVPNLRSRLWRRCIDRAAAEELAEILAAHFGKSRAGMTPPVPTSVLIYGKRGRGRRELVQAGKHPLCVHCRGESSHCYPAQWQGLVTKRFGGDHDVGICKRLRAFLAVHSSLSKIFLPVLQTPLAEAIPVH